jgi:probable H4MPT-linked C1 transfer pathway protein
MKLLILEYVTAGGLGPARAQPLSAEADAMAQAVARDFSALTGVTVILPRCASMRTPEPLPGVLTVAAPDLHDAAFSQWLRNYDAVLLIAPENSGILHRLSLQVESLGLLLLGSSAASVACAGDKWLTSLALAAAGVPQIPTCPAAAPWPALAGPWVLKPADGCGCSGVRRYPDQAAAQAGLEAHRRRLRVSAQQADMPTPLLLAQPWYDGQAASLTVLGSAQGARLLCVNRQVLQVGTDGEVRLTRVDTGALDDPEGKLAQIAGAVHSAIPGLRGIYGIDVVLGAGGARVVEVNPRVTSAYPALAGVLGCNPAQLWRSALMPVASTRRPLGSPGWPSPGGSPDTATCATRAAVLGWDLGGAHLKVAAIDAQGRLLEVVQRPCALWQGINRLTPLLDELATRWGLPDQHAVTMSGEMVDLFPDRASGVSALLESFERQVAPVPVQVYAGELGWLDPASARTRWAAVASANWLALGDWAARHLSRGVVLDVGSTTTDVLCFGAGRARPLAIGDAGRLASGELVYTGVVRTPLMALASEIALAGRTVGVMAEWFASSADVYRVLGELPDDVDLHPSADGGPKTPDASLRRLARMVGCDGPEWPLVEWRALAARFRDRQRTSVCTALDRALDRLADIPGDGLPQVVLAGAGAFLGRSICADRRLASCAFGTLGLRHPGGLQDNDAEASSIQLQESASRSAPAVAVARLWLAGPATSAG